MANNEQERAADESLRTSEMKTQSKAEAQPRSYSAVLARMNALVDTYGNLGSPAIYDAFVRTAFGYANEPFTQNMRVKAINPLPADYTKDDLNDFLRTPATSELPLREISEGLRWTAYPYFKTAKFYADILTFHSYVKPHYIETEQSKEKDFVREWRLVDKIWREFGVKSLGEKAALQSALQGKVFYITRSNIDKVHNSVNYIFQQQLPTAYTRLIGFNNISKYTVSFDMMYFLQPGTDWTQYGDLFEPYIRDFNNIFVPPEKEKGLGTKYIYAEEGSTKANIGGKDRYFYPQKVNSNGEGKPELFQQNGRWCYYVSLPIDRVWTFEIDDSTAIAVSPFSGLMQTFSQQADYEAAQLSLIMNPLIKIFTGEIPYDNSDTAKPEDSYKLSQGGRMLFTSLWNNLMAATNTGGTAFYMAPVENIKSHDYAEASNANDISASFNTYSMEKAGLTALIPVTDRPSQGTAEYSAKLESRFSDRIYQTLEKMFNHLLETLNLKYDWTLHVFGSVYLDDMSRANALKQLDKGDLSQHFLLAALDDVSVLDRLTMSKVIKGSGLLELLIPPATSYTMSSGGSAASNQTSHASGTSAEGAPTKTEVEKSVTEKEVKEVEED